MLGQCLGIWTYNFRSLVFWIYSFSGILIMYILFGQVSNHWHSMSSFFLDSAPSYSSNMFFFALEATRLVGNLRFATLTYQRLNMVRTTPPVWGGIPPGQYTIRWNLELLKIRWFRFTTRLSVWGVDFNKKYTMAMVHLLCQLTSCDQKKGRVMFFHEFFFETQTKRSSELGFTSFVQCWSLAKQKKKQQGRKNKPLNLHLLPRYCHCSCWFFLQQIQVPEVFFLFTTCPSLQVPVLPDSPGF